MTQFTREEMRAIIFLAATKVNLDNELRGQTLENAVDLFEKDLPESGQASQVDVANIALLDVINAATTGGVRPIIRFSFGNLTGAPDLNPYSSTGGGAAIDQGSRLDYTKGGDYLGEEAAEIMRCLSSGEYDEDFVYFLESQGFDVNPPSEMP